LKPAAEAGKIESKGSLDEDSVRSSDVLLMPHEEVVRRLADETRRLLDPRGSGVIDNDVFIEYITEVRRPCHALSPRLLPVPRDPRLFCRSVRKAPAIGCVRSATCRVAPRFK
jgi:hypothetical protein